MYWPVGAPRIIDHQPAFPAPTPDEIVLPHTTQGPDHQEEQSPAQSVRGVNGSTQTDGEDLTVIALRVSRNGSLFATATSRSLTIWQTRPVAVLSTVVRSTRSLATYGPSVDLLLRPDAALLVIQTTKGFLITYSLDTDSDASLYNLAFADTSKKHMRRRSNHQNNGVRSVLQTAVLENGGAKIFEARLRFRMVIRIDAGILRSLALDDELVIATSEPAALQCIRWVPERSQPQTSTEMLSHMRWLDNPSRITNLVYDRPMNLFTFVFEDGRAYAVQKAPGSEGSSFRGFKFHEPPNDENKALVCSINSKFSLIAVGCRDGSIHLYTVRDYTGGIHLLHRLALSTPLSRTGSVTVLSYSPDGYCLFAGYEKGWSTKSVFGQQGCSSFALDHTFAVDHSLAASSAVSNASWISGGSEVVLTGLSAYDIHIMPFCKAAATGCFNAANVANALLQTSSGVMIYQGHHLPDLTAISADVSTWQHVQIPVHYLYDQFPLRAAALSLDSRYLAVAGQRGLAHYSVSSGRWKTFEDPLSQDEFVVKGGMCWHHHILIAGVETRTLHEIRLYSRELALDNSKILYREPLTSPVVCITSLNNDSILVYSYENVLDHYIISATKQSVKLIKVGQIALHGIIRAPPRVRAVAWVVPDHQLLHGDPSRDVAVASVFFLLDGKLVLLQPSTTESGERKYDMRVVAQNVEWFMLARDGRKNHGLTTEGTELQGSPEGRIVNADYDHSLRDSLWLFDGQEVKVWPDVNELINTASAEYGADMQGPISIPVDFYPLGVTLEKGIIFGIESEAVQRTETDFAHYKTSVRTQLFLPSVLRYHLSQFDSPAALHLSHNFRHLPYFAHALEVLLHNVLDEEVENPPDNDNALLSSVLSFLSTFPEYLDIIVQCTRKTEVRSWRTLFRYLPSPSELFEASLQRGSLKTAGGYLLVLHTLAEITSTSPQVIRLLRAAKSAQDWELCKELSRFLVALDATGSTLRQALELMEVASPPETERSDGSPEQRSNGGRLRRSSFAQEQGGAPAHFDSAPAASAPAERERQHSGVRTDYFASPMNR